MDTKLFQDYGRRVIENCGKVIVGKEEVIRQVLVSFLCGGHVLLEDVPGTGKTMLLRAFAKTVGGIQFYTVCAALLHVAADVSCFGVELQPLWQSFGREGDGTLASGGNVIEEGGAGAHTEDLGAVDARCVGSGWRKDMGGIVGRGNLLSQDGDGHGAAKCQSHPSCGSEYVFHCVNVCPVSTRNADGAV